MAPSTPLRHPIAYFERWDRPSLSVAALIVLVEAIAAPAVVWFTMNRLIDKVGVSPGVASDVRSELVGQLFFLFLGIIVGWLFVAAIVHFFMWFSDAQHGYGTTLAIVGEAEIVALLTLPVLAVLFFTVVDQAPAGGDAAVAYFRQTGSFDSPLIFLLSVIGTLGKAAITGVGLFVAHDIRPKRAFVVTFGLGIVGLLL